MGVEWAWAITLAKATAVGAAGGFGKKAGEKLWEIFAGRIKTRD